MCLKIRGYNLVPCQYQCVKTLENEFMSTVPTGSDLFHLKINSGVL